MKNVLVFPAGSEIGLEIYRSLRGVIHYNLLGATSVADHSVFVYENMLPFLPFFDHPNFAPRLNGLLKKHDIDFLFPAHDDLVELLPILQSDGLIPRNVRIVGSPAETCLVARSKRKTYKELQDVVPVPGIFESGKPPDHAFPLFAKPDRGQGSKGARKLGGPADFAGLNGRERNELVITEYLPGPEYTIDCFTDRRGELRFARSRARTRINAGISVCSVEVNKPELQEMARAINSTLEFRGMWFFQAKERMDGQPVLLEVAPRVSGGMGFFRAKGANLPLLALYDRQDLDITIFENDVEIVRDSALQPSYDFAYEFEHVFIDLDDTLVLDGMLNHALTGLMYRWLNEKKTLHLITRHRAVHGDDPRELLHELRLNQNVFDNIIEVETRGGKSPFIEKRNAIFIDDSAGERMEVHKACCIPTFTWQQAVEVFSNSVSRINV